MRLLGSPRLRLSSSVHEGGCACEISYMGGVDDFCLSGKMLPWSCNRTVRSKFVAHRYNFE